ncbi:gliding motility protein GldL [Marinifilum sp. N1E240]|uniref:type IX secretion system motor protein PorL/GldL n=1 Tax=Marinifilum sp. N1E240 TaxID=2608082 RepID=UPI00128B806B|nr:gliding motility protein GldL [Marinifilum sp. N1E240]MPQ48063.1 gliding motility protein GldL [Marinifilum sp. N1E240]
MNITELVQSPKWKKMMGYVYGWGASVVLIGALFKIQHYPYAGELLTLGMSVEAIIFFFSAFEPPHEQPDWSLVYPELIGLEPKEQMVKGGGVQVEGLEQLQQLLEKISVEPDKLSHLSQGLAKLTNATESLSNLSAASDATDGYIQSMQKASESVGEFSGKYVDSTQQLSDSAQKLSASYEDTASTIENSGKDFAGKVNESGDNLLNSYQKIDQSLQTDFGKITENSSNYNSSMESMNKNLSSLNAIYELQLKESNQQMDNAKNLHQDLDKVLQTLTATLDNAQTYRKETEQLNTNLSALNTIYGNMLSAMDHKKKN